MDGQPGVTVDDITEAAGQPRSLIVAIPTLNEAAHIEACIRQILPQIGPDDTIVVADGGSRDATIEIVWRLSEDDPRVRILHNPKRIQSAAVNRVAELAGRDVARLLRVDAHSDYPENFVDSLVAAQRSTGAVSVVVPMRAVGETPFQRGAAAAQNSVVGNGGSLHRSNAASRFVDHGHHALFDIAAFRAVGGYDETFTHNEDFELDYRLRRAGGRIFLLQEAEIGYFPRASAGKLGRQYFLHGQGRARTILKHRLRPKLRQMLPVLILLGSPVALALGVVFWPLALLPIVYAALCIGWGAAVAVRKRDLALLHAGPAAVIMHMAWASGLVRGMGTAFLNRLRSAVPRTADQRALAPRDGSARRETD